MKPALLKIIDLGHAPPPEPYRRRLYRATNLFTINAMFWMAFAVFFDFLFTDEHVSNGKKVLPYVILFQLLVLWINRKGFSHLAISLLNMSCGIVLTYYSIRDGEASGVYMHFISALLGISIIFSNRESRIYFYLNTVFLFCCISIVITGFIAGWESIYLSETDLRNSRIMNFSISAVVSLIFSFIVIAHFSRQQKDLRKALEEKEVLLAEVFHRVKNNMAVILGLLNLKKQQSDNPETQEALQQCHMRVMSMAVVHNKIYQNKSLHDLSLNEYIVELSDEILNSLSQKDDFNLDRKLEPVRAHISVAIPLGLIINEVITNACKHAKNVKGEKLTLSITLQKTPEGAALSIKDNGQGLNQINPVTNESLGMTLIHSLSEQIDGRLTFHYNKGLEFFLEFPLV